MSRGHRRARETFDWSQTAPSTAVVETVAAVSDSDHTDLDILADAIDPDALDRLVRRPDRRHPGGLVTFRFGGYEVVVHGDGELIVTSVEKPDDG